jgi:signal transduction histidine kinase
VRDGRRAADIITRIRAVFARNEAQRPLVDLNALVRETLELLNAEAARHGAVLRTELAPETPAVPADPVQIQQVIVNLVMNAIEATRAADGPRQVSVFTRAADDGAAAVAVADNGSGLPDDPATLFEAFVTTKDGGTGLGLAISRSIIEAHQGQLTATPAPGGGAVFAFTLPAV